MSNNGSSDNTGLSNGKIDFAALKSGGYMKQIQPDLFAVRVKTLHGNATSEQIFKVAEMAQKFGRGEVHLTMRQGFEIVYVHFDNLKEITEELASVGLVLGACGPRVRTVVACQGNTLCVHGLGNTQDLAKRLDEAYYGMGGIPHKFKIGITGCPFACAKPQENDTGLLAVVEPELDPSGCIGCELCVEVCPSGALKMNEAGYPDFDRSKCTFCGECIFSCASGSWKVGRLGWNVYVGGKWGREPQIGELFEEFVTDDGVVDMIAKLIEVYKLLGNPRERFGTMINRIGLDKFKEEVRKVKIGAPAT